MSWAQTITPDPAISCRPGWCLEYVRRTYGLPARYLTATEAWEASPSKHRDRNFPPGVWVPVWYALAGVPAGHVVLRAPDGSCYSTTDLGRFTPRRHPNLADLERVYAGAGLPLTYRGWSEDVAGTPVITPATIRPAGTPNTKDWLAMATADEVRKIVREEVARVPFLWFKNKYGDDVQFESLLGQLDLNVNENHKREMSALGRIERKP